MDWADTALRAVLTEDNLSVLIGPAGARVNGHNFRDTNRVLAINVRDEVPGMQALINAWRESNINLIESGIRAPAVSPKLRPSLLADVSRVVEQAHRNGLRVEVLAQELKDRFKVSNSRAELIARDQVLKLNGQISRQRHQALGIRQYIWITAADERVREGHALLHGSTQSYDNPPDVGDGRFENPGGDYNCRCIAQPVPPSWLTEE
jgi:SPP1 gp7 family putative phage head morphogenesis protein